MALILNEYEVCPHTSKCPHFRNGSMTCQGANQNRKHTFRCSFFKDNNLIDENGFRNRYDKTGQMKIILE